MTQSRNTEFNTGENEVVQTTLDSALTAAAGALTVLTVVGCLAGIGYCLITGFDPRLIGLAHDPVTVVVVNAITIAICVCVIWATIKLYNMIPSARVAITDAAQKLYNETRAQ